MGRARPPPTSPSTCFSRNWCATKLASSRRRVTHGACFALAFPGKRERIAGHDTRHWTTNEQDIQNDDRSLPGLFCGSTDMIRADTSPPAATPTAMHTFFIRCDLLTTDHWQPAEERLMSHPNFTFIYDTTIMSTDRLPPIPSEQWTNEQRSQANEVINGPRGALISPFVPLVGPHY
jgi:hypothetical protein